MAYITREWCPQCDLVTQHIDGHCTQCVDKEKEKEKNEWDSKTLEEKVAILLERVKKLERGDIKYR